MSSLPFRSILGLLACTGGIALLACLTSMAADPPIKDRFIGTWDLVSYQVRTSSGEIREPYGENPLGRISYDAGGHMSAQLMRRDRSNPAPGGGTTGYSGYYGTYTIDEKAGTVTHHVQGAWLPGWVGSNQVRYYKLEGDRLTLQADLASGHATLVWQHNN